MSRSRIKNNGFHDLIVVNDDDSDAVHIRQHGRHGVSVLVVSRVVLPVLIEALENGKGL